MPCLTVVCEQKGAHTTHRHLSLGGLAIVTVSDLKITPPQKPGPVSMLAYIFTPDCPCEEIWSFPDHLFWSLSQVACKKVRTVQLPLHTSVLLYVVV